MITAHIYESILKIPDWRLRKALAALAKTEPTTVLRISALADGLTVRHPQHGQVYLSAETMERLFALDRSEKIKAIQLVAVCLGKVDDFGDIPAPRLALARMIVEFLATEGYLPQENFAKARLKDVLGNRITRA